MESHSRVPDEKHVGRCERGTWENQTCNDRVEEVVEKDSVEGECPLCHVLFGFVEFVATDLPQGGSILVALKDSMNTHLLLA